MFIMCHECAKHFTCLIHPNPPSDSEKGVYHHPHFTGETCGSGRLRDFIQGIKQKTKPGFDLVHHEGLLSTGLYYPLFQEVNSVVRCLEKHGPCSKNIYQLMWLENGVRGEQRAVGNNVAPESQGQISENLELYTKELGVFGRCWKHYMPISEVAALDICFRKCG